MNGIHEVTGSIPVWSTIRLASEASETNGVLSEPEIWRVEGHHRSLPPARSWQAL